MCLKQGPHNMEQDMTYALYSAPKSFRRTSICFNFTGNLNLHTAYMCNIGNIGKAILYKPVIVET